MIDPSFFELMNHTPPHYESAYHRDYNKIYSIIEDFCTTYYTEVRAVMIYSFADTKCNVYIINLGSGYYSCYDPYELVENVKAVSLEEAQRQFPKYNFTDQNYGF